MDTQGIEKWLGSIMEKLDRQGQLLEEIRQYQRMMPQVEDSADNDKWYNGERLYDNQDLCMMLQVSKRSCNATAPKRRYSLLQGAYP